MAQILFLDAARTPFYTLLAIPNYFCEIWYWFNSCLKVAKIKKYLKGKTFMAKNVPTLINILMGKNMHFLYEFMPIKMLTSVR